MLAILLLFTLLVQDPPAAKSVVATPEQQEAIQTAATAEAAAAKEVQLAQANLRVAQARTLQVIYSVMAELKLSPKEYGWKVVDGKLVFEKFLEKKQ